VGLSLPFSSLSQYTIPLFLKKPTCSYCLLAAVIENISTKIPFKKRKENNRHRIKNYDDINDLKKEMGNI
jgi:hypothetical protein